MDWKQTVTIMSDKLFPGLSHKIDEKLIGNEVLSNLPLQISLYFNVIFLPIWLIVITLFLYDQFNCFNELYKFIIITIIISLYSLEILRLYLGYEGNLRDKIPELAGFWMLSILLQLPLQSFLLFNPYLKLKILEIIVQSVMFLLLLFEIFSGYFALKYTSKMQTVYFRISNINVTRNKAKNE
ncbi:transmembrane protein 17-like [Onthophagus taurus]|uniref:transmembrane protein 17-like n=1 Tax=Onthophagus taurus TaxID=166361 RepID=UPI000C204FB2|nr:transmembrane protein 17-like [Onthophagus taurus]XP_022914662.1 transmembrane protein 17-like [Onthophagus taurus]